MKNLRIRRAFQRCWKLTFMPKLRFVWIGVFAGPKCVCLFRIGSNSGYRKLEKILFFKFDFPRRVEFLL